MFKTHLPRYDRVSKSAPARTHIHIGRMLIELGGDSAVQLSSVDVQAGRFADYGRQEGIELVAGARFELATFGL